MNIFKIWMRAATPAEQQALAQATGTSRGYFYQLSAENRVASPELAAAIERETARMAKASNGRLPALYRTDLSPVCKGCEFAQKCLGAAAVRADFPIVDADLLAALDDSEGGTHD